MALVSFTGSGHVWVPNYQGDNGSTPALRNGTTLDAPGEQYGIVFEVGHKNAGKAIDKIGVRIATVTASGNVDARIETVDLTDGDPSGALATANSNLSQSVSATGWNEWSLTASHTVSGGELLSVILEVPGGSSANIVTGEARRLTMSGAAMPYKVVNTTGSYVKSALLGGIQQMSLSVGFSDGTWEDIPGSVPIESIGSDSLSSTGTPSEAGLEFQLPCKSTLGAVVAELDPNAAAFDIHLGNGSYDPGDTGATRLATRSVDPDVHFSNSLAFVRQWTMGAEVDLEPNTTYRLTFEATTSTAVLLYFWDVDSAGLLSVRPGGTTWKYIEDNGAGGWTTTLTRLPFIHLGLSRFDDAAGGGGGMLVHPGTDGGARG
jgi:hypothetical protein